MQVASLSRSKKARHVLDQHQRRATVHLPEHIQESPESRRVIAAQAFAFPSEGEIGAGKGSSRDADGGDSRGIDVMYVPQQERIAEVIGVHLCLLRVDIVGKCDAPSLPLERVADEADAGEELRYGAVWQEA